MRDPFPAWSGMNSGRSRCTSRGGALHRKGERNSSVLPPFQESPRCLSPFQRKIFPPTASTFTLRIDSHHGGTWDSPVGSLVGKPPGKAMDPLIQEMGSVTLLLQLLRKAHVHAPIRDEDLLLWGTPDVPQDPCQHWRGILRFQARLHTKS